MFLRQRSQNQELPNQKPQVSLSRQQSTDDSLNVPQKKRRVSKTPVEVKAEEKILIGKAFNEEDKVLYEVKEQGNISTLPSKKPSISMTNSLKWEKMLKIC
eukprot:TRINITY_DN445_c0_g1_i1.p1 TRINITY_DN445_c0_g1~~TRINITY_DN445_c0_g1_i1.p1  ORF type:complete len:101 (+),score=26.43 TRINITY_DN445_c0_g1_i1:977-1279(+)